jgi:hypothetical protein
MGVCCNCDKQDILTEIKKGTMAEGSATVNNFKYIISEGVNSEKILLKQKENPLKEYSLLLFQELNKFRTEPQSYYAESIKYNFDDLVKELIEAEKEKDLKLQWSTKKETIINNIFNDQNIVQIKSKLISIKENFESIYELIILFVQGKYGNVKESLWSVLNSLKNLDEKKFKDIILNKIDYCVIYSVKSEDLVFSEKDINDKNEDKDTIVSFYFLFKYLDDNDTRYNLISNDVVGW